MAGCTRVHAPGLVTVDNIAHIVDSIDIKYSALLIHATTCEPAEHVPSAIIALRDVSVPSCAWGYERTP